MSRSHRFVVADGAHADLNDAPALSSLRTHNSAVSFTASVELSKTMRFPALQNAVLNAQEDQALVLPEPTFSLDDFEKALAAAASAAAAAADAATVPAVTVALDQALVLPEPTFSLDDIEKAMAAAAAVAVSAGTKASELGETASQRPVSNPTHEIYLQAESRSVDSSVLPSDSLRLPPASVPSWAHLISRSSVSGYLSQAYLLLCLLFHVAS